MKSLFFSVCILYLATSCRKDIQPFTDYQVFKVDNISLEQALIVNDSTLIACGGIRNVSGAIYRSDDYGKTWNKTQTALPFKNYSISTDNNGRLYCGTQFSHYYISNDTGKTWALRPMSPSELSYHEHFRIAVRAFSIPDPTHIYFCGGDFYERGAIYHSANTGVNFGFDTTQFEIRGIDFKDSLTGLIAGFGYAGLTTNGGETYSNQKLKGDFFIAAVWLNNENALIAGQNGTVFKSTDEGRTWKKVRKGNQLDFHRDIINDMKFVSESSGLMCGANGLLLLSKDAGISWIQLETAMNYNFNKISVSGSTCILTTETGEVVVLDLQNT